MSRQTHEARYWNSGGHGITIVAVVTESIDWAAYIGADDGLEETASIQQAASYGAKLSEADARHFFPEIALRYRR